LSKFIAMTVPLAFEPKSAGVMKQQPRSVNEPFLTGNRIKRIVAISLYNWTLIFGMFEWVRQAALGNLGTGPHDGDSSFGNGENFLPVESQASCCLL
jgi:magnesium-transporting ATPase (P-type)